MEVKTVNETAFKLNSEENIATVWVGKKFRATSTFLASSLPMETGDNGTIGVLAPFHAEAATEFDEDDVIILPLKTEDDSVKEKAFNTDLVPNTLIAPSMED